MAALTTPSPMCINRSAGALEAGPSVLEKDYATLIAASPELLEALDYAATSFDVFARNSEGSTRRVFEDHAKFARAAISKATKKDPRR